jgi:hypothetical protein
MTARRYCSTAVHCLVLYTLWKYRIRSSWRPCESFLGFSERKVEDVSLKRLKHPNIDSFYSKHRFGRNYSRTLEGFHRSLTRQPRLLIKVDFPRAPAAFLSKTPDLSIDLPSVPADAHDQNLEASIVNREVYCEVDRFRLNFDRPYSGYVHIRVRTHRGEEPAGRPTEDGYGDILEREQQLTIPMISSTNSSPI